MSWMKFIFLVPLANILALSMNIVKFSEIYAQKRKPKNQESGKKHQKQSCVRY